MRPTPTRTALLRDALESTVDALHRRRASDIPAGYIEDFVSLRWLEWHAGGLRLTTAGDAICHQIRAQAVAA